MKQLINKIDYKSKLFYMQENWEEKLDLLKMWYNVRMETYVSHQQVITI